MAKSRLVGPPLVYAAPLPSCKYRRLHAPDLNPNLVRVFLTNNSMRCPFLALWMQQRAATARKLRHKAKVERRWILRVKRSEPATCSRPW
jgi:hypothetical protein